MKLSALKFIATYFLFVLLFMLQKPVFMLAYHDLFADEGISDWLAVMWNGLPLDLSLAGYLSVIPGLLLIAGQWTSSRVLRGIEMGYYSLVAVIMSVGLCVDLALYGYWGVRLDVTPWFYFKSSPDAAMASVSTGYVIGGLAAVIAVAAIYIALFRYTVFRIHPAGRNRIVASVVMLLMTGLLFIPIRGGFTVSTMNLSAVYFSQKQQLNHAAINPLFSFMYSATHQNNFSDQFRYLDAEEADSLFGEMVDREEADSIPQLLSVKRPDIYIVILEGFSSHVMATLDGVAPIAVHLDSIAREGVLFTDFFANGYRTDKALPAILSGYPSQPTTSIMKYVTKTDRLPSIPRSLKNAGYEITYYYGGDANFTNMYAYLISSGFDRIVSDKDFPIGERLSKWGAHDHVVFNRCLADVEAYAGDVPTLRVVQTSSSHEPFEVPYSAPGVTDDKENAFAYTDKCLGDFVTQLKHAGKWDNSLLVIVPDHYGAYPGNITNPVERHRVPLVFAGGAVREPMRIATTASQMDIAATLLSQLGIAHDEFTFSKNILNPASPHFAFFIDQSQFGLVADGNAMVYNCDADGVVYESGTVTDKFVDKGKAFLQKLYDDLDKR